ncbi:MAG: prolyl oligopeptidase family serine peptidase, partial [Deltaproteobacteria bacterium]|nr:prolyl oligopeptidase family serine peptidase [Deltaproteobacteria bacterium]
LAEEHGFLVAYPDGFERHWNGCRRAGPYAANLQNVNDVGFAAALIERLAASDGIDRTRVFATGISNGGQLALRLALESPRRFRAVAPVIASLPAGNNMGCEPAGRPISILMLNGTDDPMNPFGGGKVALYGRWGDRGDVLSSEDMLDYWRELAGHETEPKREFLPDLAPDDGSHIERIGWQAPGRASVWLYAVHGGGHTVPHPDQRMPRLLGATNQDAAAAELIWRFFDAAPARP